jgi:hypothetical protein
MKKVTFEVILNGKGVISVTPVLPSMNSGVRLGKHRVLVI